jgi:hypothetical protein
MQNTVHSASGALSTIELKHLIPLVLVSRSLLVPELNDPPVSNPSTRNRRQTRSFPSPKYQTQY